MPDTVLDRISRREFLARGGTALAAIAQAAGPVSAGVDRSLYPYDTVIRGGLVYDGVSDKPRKTDVAVRDDRIVEVGPCAGGALRTIAASGLVVMPGIINVHDHSDAVIQAALSRPQVSRIDQLLGNWNSLYQGVTTVVTGNCGMGMPDTADWLGRVRSLGFGANVYHLIPHGMLRLRLFGSCARPLTARELVIFKNAVAEEMKKGAVGLSTGLEYAPGLFCDTEEIIALSTVVARWGGLYASHIRDESGAQLPGGKCACLEFVREAVTIGELAGLPVQVSHLKISAPFGRATPDRVLEIFSEAKNRGLDVTADQYPYDASSTILNILLPPSMIGADNCLRPEYRTREGRARVRDAVKDVLGFLPPEKILISVHGNRSWEGKTIRQISEAEHTTPDALLAGMMSDSGGSTKGVFFRMKEKYVRKIMKSSFVFTSSDGSTMVKSSSRPHPRAYGTFPRKIRRYALDEKEITLAFAIKSMTSLPARKFGIKGRGSLVPGHFADITVFDPKTIRDEATFADPERYATGVRHVLINGIPVLKDGVPTGRRGGRACRRGT